MDHVEGTVGTEAHSGELKEAELIGLAAYVFAEAVCFAGTNQSRALDGTPPVYTDFDLGDPAMVALQAELKRRGILG